MLKFNKAHEPKNTSRYVDPGLANNLQYELKGNRKVRTVLLVETHRGTARVQNSEYLASDFHACVAVTTNR